MQFKKNQNEFSSKEKTVINQSQSNLSANERAALKKKEAENAESKYVRMTTEPVQKLVVTMALPTIVTMLISTFYNMADTYFVSQINTNATAAVGIVYPLMTLMQAIGFLFGHGSGNFMSRAMGKKEYDQAEIMASTGFFSALIFGILLMVLGLVFLDPLCIILGAPDEVLEMTKTYAGYILLGAPFIMCTFVLNNQLRFQGNAFFAMIGTASGAVLNVVLDPIFIFVLDTGVAGAALATIISQFVGFWLLVFGTTRKGNVHLRLKNFKPSVWSFGQIFKGGFPSLCRQGITTVSTVCLNLMAGFYGVSAIAAMSIVNRVGMFFFSALVGFGQGFQPVCGFNYGAGKYERVLKAFWFSVKTSAVALVVLAAAQFMLAPQIVKVFRKDDLEVIEIGVAALRFQCLALPLCSWVVMSNMMIQTIGHTLKASILAVARQGICYIPMLLILSPLGVLGLEMTQMMADILAFVVALLIGLGEIREMKRLMQQRDAVGIEIK